MTDRSSSGGAAAARGTGAEPRIFSWLAAHALAAEPLPGDEWVPDARITDIGMQTAKKMDDVEFLTGRGGHVFIQSKNSLRLVASEDSDLGEAVGQAVQQYLAGTGSRGIEESRDRLVIVTDGGASQPVRRHLAQVVDRLATLPVTSKAEEVCRSEDDRKALRILQSHIERSWIAQTGRKLCETDLRALFRVLRVRVLQLGKGEPNRVTAESLLRRVLVDPERASTAFELLRSLGQDGNERQRWNRRQDLIQALEHEGCVLTEGAREESSQGIQRMLVAQERAAEFFANPLIERRLMVASDVYVRQVFSSPRTTDEDADDTRAGSMPPAGFEASAPQPIQAVLSGPGARHLLVFGVPGVGKSTLTLQETARLARQALGREPRQAGALLPLRVSAADLAASDGSWSTRLWESAMRLLASNLDRRLPADLLSAGDVQWLVMIDGLDEVTDPSSRSTVVKTLARRARQDSRMRLLITTRPLPADQVTLLQQSGFDAYELQPFDHERLTEFANKWFKAPEVASRFLSQVGRAGLHELVRVPLLATVAAILHEQEPQRPLPANRYALYEQYRSHLRQKRTAAARERGKRALAADELDRRMDELLQHLAQIQITRTAPDLLVAARRWTQTEIGMRETVSTPGWPELVAEALTDTGFLVRVGSGVRFVHASFAEHLAAEAEAERLPEQFDADDPDWQAALGRAVRAQSRAADSVHLPGDEDVARAVLVHYTYQRPGPGAALGSRLQHGGSLGRLLAGHLLAEGGLLADGAVEEPLITQFLDQLRDAVHRHEDDLQEWFRIAGYLRAAPVTEYFRTLAQDRREPAYERIQAARALAVHHPDCSARALRALAEDEATDPNMLGWVAQLLHEADSTQTEYAAGVLHRMLARPSVAPESRRGAAETLASFGGTYLEQAAMLLTAMATDPTATVSDRLDAARMLRPLGPAFSTQATRALRAIYQQRDADGFIIAGALRELSVLDPDFTDAQAEGFLAELESTTDCPEVVRGDVLWLTASGPRHTEATAAALRTMIANPHVSDATRQTAEDELRRLLPSESTRVVPSDRSVPFPASISTQPPAQLCRVLADPEEDDSRRLDAARELSEWGPAEQERAAAALRGTLAVASTSHDLYTTALVMDELGRVYTPEAASILKRLITDPGMPHQDRIHAARTLIDLGPQYAEEAAGVLQTIIANAATNPDSRRDAIQTMGFFRPEFAPRAAAYLRSLMAAPTTAVPSEHRSICAEALGHLGPLWAQEAARTLRQTIERDSAPGTERLDCATSLAELGYQYRVEAIAFLRTFMTDRTQLDDDRFRASLDLYDLAEEYGHETAQVLRETAPEFYAALVRPPGHDD
ncbi:hypothetical protein AB0F96_37090 [Streptomyces sp. NPDC023998]|uniref:NACHT domain-containing protein n=1 Tax=Streptomyces sp. NPDC023998 TaxID=3154597 RepID=UPI0033FFFA9E